MSRYWLTPATEEHAKKLAASIAKEDAQEVYELDGSGAEESIIHSIKKSPGAMAWGTEDRVLCIYGIRPVMLLPRVGCIWMLSAGELPKHARPFLRGSKLWVQYQRKQYDLLVNYVVAWHVRSLRWLAWLGFTVCEPPVRIGKTDSLWHRVELRGNS